MIDTWLVSAGREAFAALREACPNMIGPQRGRGPVAADPEADPPVGERPAAGDPDLWYACVRAEAIPVLTEGVAVVETAIGESVLGV